MADTITANFRAAPQGVDADAQVIINNQPRIVPPSNYSTKAPDLSTRRYGQNTLDSTVTSRTETRPQSSIHWGGVMKGVAIVTAVAVAAVIVYPLAVEAAASALAWANSSPVLGPIIGGVQAAGAWALHGLAYGAEWLGAFFSNTWVTVAPAAAAASQAAPAALSAGQIGAAAHGAGLLASAGTLVTGAALAAPALAHTQFIDHHQAIIQSTTSTPMVDAGSTHSADQASLGLLASKTTAMHAVTQHDAMHQAADLAQHSTHHLSSHEHARGAPATATNPEQNADAPETNDRRAVSEAVRSTKEWKERVGGSRAGASRMADIAPRDTSYALQTETDRLNKSLAASENGVV